MQCYGLSEIYALPICCFLKILNENQESEIKKSKVIPVGGIIVQIIYVVMHCYV